MKVTFKYGIGTFLGKIDNSVFWPQKSGLASVMRKFTYPTLTIQNERIGLISKNLALIWHQIRSGWRADIYTYALRYYTQYGSEDMFDPARSPYAFYTKAMWNMYKDDPDNVDLSTITIEDIRANDDMQTVKKCIENGYLRSIDMYNDLIQNM
ncbi:MAG: hypothetical protein BWX63_02391 [Bacteroidetes bacterium ADurb.Bin041]|nr:MAG: hypothetical protein BWX63_02391 [Bacteroidetes bacterium ADurb.Bin041]